MIVEVCVVSFLAIAALAVRHARRQIAAAQAMADKYQPKDPQKKE